MNRGIPHGQPIVWAPIVPGPYVHAFVDTSVQWSPPSMVLYRVSITDWDDEDPVTFEAIISQPCSASRK